MKILLRNSGLAVLLYGAIKLAAATTVILPPDINYTALHKSAENCDVENLRLALDAVPAPQKDAAINRLDREGYAPIGYAARAVQNRLNLLE